jgi:hypothetical protein
MYAHCLESTICESLVKDYLRYLAKVLQLAAYVSSEASN